MAKSKMILPIANLTCAFMKILILLAVPTLLFAEKDCVQGVSYLDPVTGNCDPCNDICDHSREQGTRARCDRLCKGYKSPLSNQCPSGQYFDQNVGRCDYCDTICLPPRQDDCKKLCPDWTTSTESPLVSLNIGQTTDHLHTTLARQIGQNSDDVTGSKIHVIILTVIGILLVVAVVVICYTFRNILAKRLKAISGWKCKRRATQEQGDTVSPMIQIDTPIVRNGMGPFSHPVEERV